ncbi:MAG: diguanylate cyclase, partial [Nitrospirae bacterium]|nr:diguanylate cyclase [Nitrospirota bacterium]
MKAHKGLPSTLLKGCGYLKKGVCLCGRAALTGETIFKSELESHHDISFIGMHDHGHYCVPIISKEKVLGVINLYVPQGHKRSDLEDDFLTAVANVLAGMIERKIAEDMYHHVVSYDSLTGLLNRAQFFDRLQHEMKASKRRGQQLAVLYINVDNFKTINDAMGHDTGDAVIKEVAARLTGSVRESDTAARMSGDEFSVIASNIETINDAEVIAQKILSASREPLETPKCSLNITLSIGISIFPADTQGAAELLKQSEIALYHSKKSGKNMYSFFNPEMDAQIAERVRLENELREAIDNNELVIHYQPQIDIKNGRLTGAEALVRWQHPSNGMIPSFKFIPIAEDTGL